MILRVTGHLCRGVCSHVIVVDSIPLILLDMCD